MLVSRSRSRRARAPVKSLRIGTCACATTFELNSLRAGRLVGWGALLAREGVGRCWDVVGLEALELAQ